MLKDALNPLHPLNPPAEHPPWAEGSLKLSTSQRSFIILSLTLSNISSIEGRSWNEIRGKRQLASNDYLKSLLVTNLASCVTLKRICFDVCQPHWTHVTRVKHPFPQTVTHCYADEFVPLAAETVCTERSFAWLYSTIFVLNSLFSFLTFDWHKAYFIVAWSWKRLRFFHLVSFTASKQTQQSDNNLVSQKWDDLDAACVAWCHELGFVQVATGGSLGIVLCQDCPASPITGLWSAWTRSQDKAGRRRVSALGNCFSPLGRGSVGITRPWPSLVTWPIWVWCQDEGERLLSYWWTYRRNLHQKESAEEVLIKWWFTLGRMEQEHVKTVLERGTPALLLLDILHRLRLCAQSQVMLEWSLKPATLDICVFRESATWRSKCSQHLIFYFITKGQGVCLLMSWLALLKLCYVNQVSPSPSLHFSLVFNLITAAPWGDPYLL